ncbi:hypothetical protein OL548_23495 [Lysinibacillus sp. MHQ-1]|nr:hypothetical protein OL548_23495 [Lysinibacillus sp. MHQ-1]
MLGKNGGRYYQGPYLANPARNLVDKDVLKERFKKRMPAIYYV